MAIAEDGTGNYPPAGRLLFDRLMTKGRSDSRPVPSLARLVKRHRCSALQ